MDVQFPSGWNRRRLSAFYVELISELHRLSTATFILSHCRAYQIGENVEKFSEFKRESHGELEVWLNRMFERENQVEEFLILNIGGDVGNIVSVQLTDFECSATTANSLACEFLAMAKMNLGKYIERLDSEVNVVATQAGIRELNRAACEVTAIIQREWAFLKSNLKSNVATEGTPTDNGGQAAKKTKKTLRSFGQKELDASEEFKRRRNDDEPGLTLSEFCKEYTIDNNAGSHETLCKNLSSNRYRWDHDQLYK